MHPFVLGEVALGTISNRRVVLSFLRELPKAVIGTDPEVLEFIERYSLNGKGVSYVDAHLLVSARLKCRRAPACVRAPQIWNTALDHLQALARRRRDAGLGCYNPDAPLSAASRIARQTNATSAVSVASAPTETRTIHRPSNTAGVR